MRGSFNIVFQCRDDLALLPQVLVIVFRALPDQQAAGARQRLLLVVPGLAGAAQRLVALFGIAHHVEQLGGLPFQHRQAIARFFNICQRTLQLAQPFFSDFHLLVILGVLIALHDAGAALCALVDEIVEFRQALLPLVQNAHKLLQVAQLGELQLQAVALHHLQQIAPIDPDQSRNAGVFQPAIALQIRRILKAYFGKLQLRGRTVQIIQVGKRLRVLPLSMLIGLQCQLWTRQLFVAVRQGQQCFLHLR